MKIGLVLSQPPGYSETFFHSKINGLQQNGARVILFCQHKKDSFDLCSVIISPKVTKNPILQVWYFIWEFLHLVPHLPVIFRYIKIERCEGTKWIQLFKNIYLNAHLLKSNLDWLHFGFATLSLGSESVAKAINAQMAVSLRGFDMAIYPVKNPGCYEKLWRYVNKIHTISNDLLNLAKIHGLSDAIKVEKITPAINIEMFHNEVQKFPEDDTITFMTTARLHWKKGLVQIIEALALLKTNQIKFIYKIVGEGTDYERIAYAAYQLGVRENVRFLGKLSHSEVKKELAQTDIYLQYSLQEGFCNAVLEAQAMGKLCIVSTAEGLSENVLHNITGWVVPKNRPELLFSQIMKVILMDATEKTRISQNAIERVQREFNLEIQSEHFMKFYAKEI